jgi:hypothetical protein
MENVRKFSQLEDNPNTNKDIRSLCDYLEKFNYDEYQRFFQMLGNYQHITSNEANSIHLGGKDLITIDEKRLNYNENNLIWQDGQIEMNNLIKRKDIPNKLFNKEIENEIIRQPSMDESAIIGQAQNDVSVMRSMFENIMTNLKKTIVSKNIEMVKNVIKIYSYMVNIYHGVKFDREDSVLIDLIKENCSESFYAICKYWLYQDFLMNDDSRRYETLLAKIISKLESENEKYRDINNLSPEWKNFIEGLPRITQKVVDHLFKVMKEELDTYVIMVKKLSPKEKPSTPTIYYIIHKAYLKLKRQSVGEMAKINLDLTDQILKKYLEIFKINDIRLIANTVGFLAENLYKSEQYKIKEFAQMQFSELKNIPTYTSDEIIKCKYTLFMYLCTKDKSLILNFPEVYSNTIPKARVLLEDVFKNILRKFDTQTSSELIKYCSSADCLPIVLIICDYIKFENNIMSLSKLVTNIKKFLDEYYKNDTELFTRIMIILVDKIPISLFFSSFIFKKTEPFSEDKIKIYETINKIENKNLLNNDLFTIDSNPELDNIILYITYYILANDKSSTPKFDSDISLLFEYYNALSPNIKSLSLMFSILINSNKTKENNFLALITLTHEIYKDNLEIKQLILSNFNIIQQALKTT